MKFLLYWIILLPFALTAQVKDDFADGNFTSDPAWTGDTSSFIVNSQFQLQLNSSGSDTTCLVTQNMTTPEMECSFWIKMSFNSSLNNYARVYLCSDSRDLRGALNGIYIQLGGTGDSIIIYRQNGKVHTPLFKFPFLRTNKSTNIFRIKICRDSAGTWDLYADSTGGKRFSRYGSFPDKQTAPTAWLGVYCRYTSSNSTAFCFDDFYSGLIIRDTIPPAVISAGFSDSLTISIKFNEFIDSTSLDKGSNFTLKNNPEKIQEAYILKTDPSIIFIKINTNENKFFCDTLITRNISDLSGNFVTDTSVYLCYYIPGPCQRGDLVINEVLFHPDASGSRFIEFYNRSSKVIRLNTVSVRTSVNSETAFHYEILSKTGRLLLPEDFYVITADSAKLCSRYNIPDPDKISEPADFPGMKTDSGFVEIISNTDSVLIDAMSYSQSMHLPFLINTEGVSLERLDPQIPSDYRANWQSASETSGFASPGYENSHYAIEPGNGTDIQLSSSIISPDNDGKDDFLYIKVNTVEPGTLFSLRVFDLKGNLVKTITSPSTISENSIFIWDGTGDSNLILPMGYYLIFSESISVSGKHSSVKKAIVIAQKL